MKDHTHEDVWKEMDEYTNKLAASWPPAIEPGMMFKRTNVIVETVLFAQTGWNVKAMRGGIEIGRIHMPEKDLNPKAGWKFLRRV